MGKSSSKAARDNRSNQMNPNSPTYSSSPSSTKVAADNRAGQLNPNNDAYWQSRGVGRPGEESTGYMGAALVDRDSVPAPNRGTPPSPYEPLTKKSDESKADDDDWDWDE